MESSASGRPPNSRRGASAPPPSEASAEPVRGERLLEAIAERRHEIVANEITVVVAHPDDETIGCGALLSRLSGAAVVMVTDGAPRSLVDARACGFETAAAYAAARAKELRAALDIAGIPDRQIVELGVPDQEAGLQLAALARRLADLFPTRRTIIVLTHAYEGGHPDHDATAFAVHAAAALLARQKYMLPILEMPLYHLARDGGMRVQQFADNAGRFETTLALDDGERDRKRRMLAAHETQRQTLAPFAVDAAERFRLAPQYDFRRLPNEGRLLYEAHDWGMTGERWGALVTAAIAELELGDRF